MSLRRILVPVLGKEEPGSADLLETPALEAAFTLGEYFQAHVDVVCIEAERTDRMPTPWWIPDSGVGELLDLMDRRDSLRRTQARETFDRIARERLPPVLGETPAAEGYSVSFVELPGETAGTLSVQGRLADLIVVAHAGIPPERLVEVALRETGRPVLVLPRTPTSRFGQHVAIAWNGSVEASRAVALGMDFLQRAERLTVIAINEDEEPSAARLVEYLAWHGLEIEIIRAEAPALNTGEILSREVERAGADLLLMGAHSRNRLRELILGDVTDFVLREAAVPALLVH